MGIDPLSSSDCNDCCNDEDEIKNIESDIIKKIANTINDDMFNNNDNQQNNNNELLFDEYNNKNNSEKHEKRIYLNSDTILPNTTSQLFEIKLLLNFDVVRNRWIILKEQYEFLLRLKCIESLTVIHLVMVHQNAF